MVPVLDVTVAYGLRFLYPQSDTAVGRRLRDYGEFARPELDLIGDYLKSFEAGTYIDVGANIGAIALPLAARFRKWKVLAFEAHRGLSQPNQQPPKSRSDLNFLALSDGVPNLWNLTKIRSVTAAHPTTANEFGYLARYGYKF